MSRSKTGNSAARQNDSGRMRAITVPRYGGPEVLRCTQLPIPEPREGHVLVRVRAAAVNAADWRLMRANPWMVRLAFGLRAPRFTALGMALSGEVVAGSAAGFAVGDPVMADLSAAGCSAFADYVSVDPEVLVAVPAGLEHAAAATLPLAATTALQALRDHARVHAGQRVLVTGASGAVGLAAVSIARSMGAKVWAVSSTPHLELVAAAGATRVLDRRHGDILADPDLPRESFDAIIDTAGYRRIFDWGPRLTPTGIYIHVGGSMRELARTAISGGLRSRRRGRRWKTFTATASTADLAEVARLAADGHIRPVIAARYRLEDAAQAMSAAEQGAVSGRVVLVMDG